MTKKNDDEDKISVAIDRVVNKAKEEKSTENLRVLLEMINELQNSVSLTIDPNFVPGTNKPELLPSQPDPLFDRALIDFDTSQHGPGNPFPPRNIALGGDNFENYAENFFNYAQNFENYAQSLSSDQKEQTESSMAERRLAAQENAGRINTLPNGISIGDLRRRIFND